MSECHSRPVAVGDDWRRRSARRNGSDRAPGAGGASGGGRSGRRRGATARHSGTGGSDGGSWGCRSGRSAWSPRAGWCARRQGANGTDRCEGPAGAGHLGGGNGGPRGRGVCGGPLRGDSQFAADLSHAVPVRKTGDRRRDTRPHGDIGAVGDVRAARTEARLLVSRHSQWHCHVRHGRHLHHLRASELMRLTRHDRGPATHRATSRPHVMPLLVAAPTLLGLLAFTQASQTTPALQACFVPESGTMYVVGQGGSPTNCRAAGHVLGAAGEAARIAPANGAGGRRARC